MKYIFWKKKIYEFRLILQTFVPKGQIHNIPADNGFTPTGQ